MLARLMGALPVVVCLTEHVPDVIEAARAFLDEGTWEPPLPDGYSLMALEHPEEPRASMILAHGLEEMQVEVLVDHFEKHPQQRAWDMWAANDEGLL